MILYQTSPHGWDPFAETRRLQAEMNRLFEGTGLGPRARGFPPVNIWLGENSVVVTAELPGLSESDIELNVLEDSLSIQGERKPVTAEKEIAWHRRERGHGTFNRTVELPFRIDPGSVKACFVNGVLEVEMQRPSVDRPRKIAISAA